MKYNINMKKLSFIILLCLGLLTPLTAQNVWKDIDISDFESCGILGVGTNGSIFIESTYGIVYRSQDDGLTWDTIINTNEGLFFHSYDFYISRTNRIHIYDYASKKIIYSDDDGDSWQQTPPTPINTIYVRGMYSTSNDTLLVWDSSQIFWTIDEGDTWNTTTFDFINEEIGFISCVIVNEAGDVYASVYGLDGENAGIYHSTLSDMQNWTLAAFEGHSIPSLTFDPEGNVIANSAGEGTVGCIHEPGFYLFTTRELAVSEDGIIYKLKSEPNSQVRLNYTTNHGEQFYDIGETMPVYLMPYPGSSDAHLFNGNDNHLYYRGGGIFYKSIKNADEIINPYPTELPGQYWYDLVTEQPEGYVVDDQGDIHIYTAEALAWLISVSNGLNGVERDDFAGKNIILEADVDISAGIWTSIGTKNELPPSPPTKDDEFYFQGNFNGNGHVIYGMATNEGFIGDVYNSRLENIVIKYAFAKDTEQGVLVNRFSRSVIDRCWLDCVVHVNDNGGYALFGYGGAITQITNCIFRSPLIDNPSGGIPHGSFCAFIEGNNAFNEVDNCAIIIDNIAYPLDAPIVVENNSGVMRNCYSYMGAFKNYDPQAFLYNGRCGIVGIDYGTVEHCYYNWLDPEVYGEEVNNPALFSHEDLDATMFRWIDDEWALLEPVTVGGTETDNLTDALNLWTNTQTNISDYLQWREDYTVLPNGLPVLYEEEQYFPRGTEWYYEIKHLTGGITYQHLEYTADTAVNSKRVKIIAETNTMYDKEQWTDFEYIYEDGDRIYWWNKDLEDFTLLYDFGAEVGDEWEINGGWFTITVHVDAAQTVTFKSQLYRVLSVSDVNGLFTGDIICGIGHQERFFPESPIAKDYEVDGLRCFWQDGELVLTMGDEDCDAVYYDYHDVDENPVATFTVYPNPTDGLLFVEGQGEYRLTNPLGQILLLGTTTKTIDVSSLPAGLYFLTIGDQTQKIIINRIP